MRDLALDLRDLALDLRNLTLDLALRLVLGLVLRSTSENLLS